MRKIALTLAALGAVVGLMGAPAHAQTAEVPVDCNPLPIVSDLPYPWC